MKIHVFLSHASKDKRLASELKTLLEALGLQVFVAHTDIPGGEKWRAHLIQELRNSDILIALLTKQYHVAEFTDHEFGMAVVLDKIIFPLGPPSLLYGFMKDYQTVELDRHHLKNSVVELGSLVAANTLLKRRFRRHIAKNFKITKDFNCAITAARVIKTLSGFTDTEINRIARAAATHDQIYNSYALQEIRYFIRHKKACVTKANWVAFARMIKAKG